MRKRCEISRANRESRAPRPVVRIAVARRRAEIFNLKETTVRSLAILLLESRAPSGGVVEAGLG